MHAGPAVHCTHLVLITDAEGADGRARGATGRFATLGPHGPPRRAPRYGAARLNGHRMGAAGWASLQVCESASLSEPQLGPCSLQNLQPYRSI